MTVEDCIEDERWGEWWCIQRVPVDADDDVHAWQVIDAEPDCAVRLLSLGKTIIDACIKAIEKRRL